MQTTNTIDTDRLTLRVFREEDIEPLYQMQSDAEAMRYTFRASSRQEINAFAHRENQASIRLLEKCGFQFQCFEPRLNRNHYIVYREAWLKARRMYS